MSNELKYIRLEELTEDYLLTFQFTNYGYSIRLSRGDSIQNVYYLVSQMFEHPCLVEQERKRNGEERDRGNK
jgi:hypothetical protein